MAIIAAMDMRWKPNVTVAAIVEEGGRYLLVEEETSDGLRLNNPAGHMEPAETLIQACARETLEETTHLFTPQYLLGIYMSRFAHGRTGEDITYLRLAFGGTLGPAQTDRKLDEGIVRTVWMTPEELRACPERHRSPLLMRCIEDHQRGQRYPLDVIHTEAAVWALGPLQGHKP